jgi:cytoskeletal protein RodZ
VLFLLPKFILLIAKLAGIDYNSFMDYSKGLKKNLRKGITFIEIMVACLLMVVVFIIGWTISNSFSGVSKVRSYETAVFLANQAIEAIRAARSTEIGSDKDKSSQTLMGDFSSSKDTFDDNYDGFVPSVEIGGIIYKRKVSVENIDSMNADIQTGLKIVRVNVSWQAAEDGAPVEFEVVTTHCDLW